MRLTVILIGLSCKIINNYETCGRCSRALTLFLISHYTKIVDIPRYMQFECIRNLGKILCPLLLKFSQDVDRCYGHFKVMKLEEFLLAFVEELVQDSNEIVQYFYQML